MTNLQLLNRLVDFVVAERWRGDVFVGYTPQDILFEIATHSNGLFKGAAYVEEDGKITGIVTGLPLNFEDKSFYVRNILCTTRTAFQKLIKVVGKYYGPDWTLYAKRYGKTRKIGTVKDLTNKLVNKG